jgi:hypothetical protein
MSASSEVMLELLRWIRDGRSDVEQTLPSIPNLARRFNVGQSSVREALQMLEVLGLVRSEAGRRLKATLPVLTMRVDGLSSYLKAASSAEHVHAAVRSWFDLKWVLAREVLEAFAREGPASEIEEVVSTLYMVEALAIKIEPKAELVDLEVSALWRAAHRVDRPGLQTLANSVAGAVWQLKPLWERLVDPELTRDRAVRLVHLLKDRDETRVRTETEALRIAEWDSWLKRLAWARRRRDSGIPGLTPPNLEEVLDLPGAGEVDESAGE